MEPLLSLDDLMAMDGHQLEAVMARGHAVPTGGLEGTVYHGVDLSLPRWMQRILWQTFAKTFHRDAPGGPLRGWNVRVEQTGVGGELVYLRDRRGEPLTFGHYHLRDASPLTFPWGWSGAHYLDYRHAGNTFFDLARLATTPLIAVNEGSDALLLGWELFNVAGLMIPLRLYWALRRHGPLDHVAPPPRG